MNVRITTAQDALELLEQRWPTLAVSLVGDDLRFPLSSYGPHHLIQWFHDVEGEVAWYSAPTKQQIVKVLEHTKNLEAADRLLVHCHAGKSRSPAMALGILIQNGFSPKEAFEKIKTIRPELIPNRLIVRLVDEVLRQLYT
jgi:predicted protein tyrosine phosphatase